MLCNIYAIILCQLANLVLLVKSFFSDDFDSLFELKNNGTLHKDVLDIFLNQQSKHNIGRGVYTWTSDPHSPAEQSFYSQTFIPTDIV